ncbi:MAG: hypothetical protein OQL19_10990 [Gammaproteobacteria bacterium]|nr:hypothetical protein [Gammaproteobacteria bacterium]
MLTEMRQKQRNEFERRVHDRRQNDFKFNSVQWVKHVRQTYAAWPKKDRRQVSRRDGERRHIDQMKYQSSYFTDFSSDLLSKEERLYFDELFTNSDD